MDIDQVGGVFAGVAGGAVVRLVAFAGGFFEAFEGEVGEGVGAYIVADLVDGHVGGDELFFGRGIDAVEAWGDGGRAGDAHVDFGGSGFADHANDFFAGGAADDGIVDEDDALAFEEGADGVELELDAEVADALFGLDEGAADVVVADESEAEGDAGFGGVAHGGGDAGVGDGDDDVGGDVGLAGELAAHGVAGGLDAAAEDDAIGTREVNVLEDAARLLERGGVEARVNAFGADDDHLAGADVALVVGADEVEGAGFAGEDDGLGAAVGGRDAAHAERTEAAGIAGGEDAVGGGHDQRERAFDAAQGVGHGVF